MAPSLALVLLAFFASGLVLNTILLGGLLRCGIGKLFEDPPGRRKIHQKTVPRAGGAALVGSFVLALALWPSLASTPVSSLDDNLQTILAFTAASFFLIGILDDTFSVTIQNRAKLFLELLAATEIVLLTNLHFDFFSTGQSVHSLGLTSYPLSVLWIAAMANAVNIIDGVDGLAGSVVSAALLTLGALAWLAGRTPVLLCCALLLGLVCAFLLFNRPPARVFLGDTGSLFLGAILGVLSMDVARSATRVPTLAILFFCGLPLLDLCLSMVRRFLKAHAGGAPWYRCFHSMTQADNAHIHHRLVHRGLSHSQTSLLLLLLAAGLGATAVLVQMTSFPLSLIPAFYALAVLAWFLHRLDFYRLRILIRGTGKSAVHSPRIAVAVIAAGPVLRQALGAYRQNEFAFHFLTEQTALRQSGYAAVVLAEPEEGFAQIEYPSRIADVHGCPILVIASPGSSAGDFSGQGIVYAHRPVYVPALLFELYRLAGPGALRSTQQHINIARLSSDAERALYVKKF